MSRTSPVRAFTRYRMEEARGLLARDDLSIKEISARLGFQNQFHFSRLYRKVFGRAPSAARQQSGIVDRLPGRP